MTVEQHLARAIQRHRSVPYFSKWVSHNKVEAPAVVGYLDGGVRPADAIVRTSYGRAFMDMEDARRKAVAEIPDDLELVGATLVVSGTLAPLEPGRFAADGAVLVTEP